MEPFQSIVILQCRVFNWISIHNNKLLHQQYYVHRNIFQKRTQKLSVNEVIQVFKTKLPNSISSYPKFCRKLLITKYGEIISNQVLQVLLIKNDPIIITLMKAVVLLALLALTLSLTDKEIIQQALNGGFTQNKLPNPTTIVPCIDDVSAHQIVVFVGTVLDKAAKGSLSDLLSLPKLIKDFGDTLNPAVGECLDGNAELDKLSAIYNPKNESSDAIEKKIITYVTLHYLTVHKWLGDLDDTWHAANYYQVGFKGATYAHNVLGLSVEELVHKHPILGSMQKKEGVNRIMKLLKQALKM